MGDLLVSICVCVLLLSKLLQEPVSVDTSETETVSLEGDGIR